jgi:hypothetical protein
VKHMVSRTFMGIVQQNLADPCAFMKIHEGKTVLILAITHMSMTQSVVVWNKSLDRVWFSQDQQYIYVKQCFNSTIYTDMGNLKRYLGIWYEWKQDEEMMKMEKLLYL